MAPFPELLKVVRLALMPRESQASQASPSHGIRPAPLSPPRSSFSPLAAPLWVCRSFCGSRNQITGIDNSVGVRLDMFGQPPSSAQLRLPCFRLCPPVAPPLIRFENGVLGIVGNYFGGLFSALSFDFPSHVRSPMEARRSLLARKST